MNTRRMATLGLVLSIGILTTIHLQQAFATLNPGVHNNAAIASPYVPIYPYVVSLKAQIAWLKTTIEQMVAAPIIPR
jgi:hypothetical protein